LHYCDEWQKFTSDNAISKNFKVELFLTLIKTVFVAKVKFILFALPTRAGHRAPQQHMPIIVGPFN
jgi:hypothetical protein